MQAGFRPKWNINSKSHICSSAHHHKIIYKTVANVLNVGQNFCAEKNCALRTGESIIALNITLACFSCCNLIRTESAIISIEA